MSAHLRSLAVLLLMVMQACTPQESRHAGQWLPNSPSLIQPSVAPDAQSTPGHQTKGATPSTEQTKDDPVTVVPSVPTVTLDKAGGRILSDVQTLTDDVLSGTSFVLDGTPGDVTLQIATNDIVGMFASNVSEASKHAYWKNIGATIEQNDAGRTRITFPADSKRPSRYLAAGQETTQLPDSMSLSPLPDVQDEITTVIGSDETFSVQVIFGNIVPPASQLVKDDRRLLVLVHGAGSEHRGDEHLWKNFKNLLKTNPAFAKQISKRFIVVEVTYSSKKVADAVAHWLVRELVAKYGPRYVILVGHSMGGLISRAAYPLSKESLGLIAGVITLGSPHNGADAPNDPLNYAGFSLTPDPTLHRGLFNIARYDLLGGLVSSVPVPLNAIVGKTDGFSTPGLDSLTSYESEFGIPFQTFTTRLSLGPAPGIMLQEELTPWSAFRTPAEKSALYARADLKGRLTTHIVNGKVYINDIQAIQKLEEVTGCATEPHVIAYGGYDDGSSSLERARSLFERARKRQELAKLIGDVSYEVQHALLAWVGRSILPLYPTASGRKSRPFDGLVRLESAFGLLNGPAIEDPTSSDEAVMVNEQVIQSRLPKWMLGFRLMKDYDHLDLAIGKTATGSAEIDTGYFGLIFADIIWLDDRILARASSVITSEDREAIFQMVKRDVSDPQNGSEPGANGQTHFFSSRLSSQDVLYSLQASDTVAVQASLYQEDRIDFKPPYITGYQFYRATVSRRAGRWYVRTPGYIRGGFIE